MVCWGPNRTPGECLHRRMTFARQQPVIPEAGSAGTVEARWSPAPAPPHFLTFVREVWASWHPPRSVSHSTGWSGAANTDGAGATRSAGMRWLPVEGDSADAEPKPHAEAPTDLKWHLRLGVADVQGRVDTARAGPGGSQCDVAEDEHPPHGGTRHDDVTGGLLMTSSVGESGHR